MFWPNMIFFISFLMLSVTMNAQSEMLADYRWENRVVLLFAPEESNLDFNTQQKIIDKDKIEYQDRDLVVLSFILDDEKGKELRSKFNIKSGLFSFVLIGKDGYQKMMSHKVVRSKDLFELIDAMPMRRNEMKRNKY